MYQNSTSANVELRLLTFTDINTISSGTPATISSFSIAWLHETDLPNNMFAVSRSVAGGTFRTTYYYRP